MATRRLATCRTPQQWIGCGRNTPQSWRFQQDLKAYSRNHRERLIVIGWADSQQAHPVEVVARAAMVRWNTSPIPNRSTNSSRARAASISVPHDLPVI
jgi:hypothetical protein